MTENHRGTPWRLAACTVAVAAAVSSAPAAGSAAIDQIQRYCTRSWQNAGIAPQDWPDCTQQALLELLERVSQRGLAEAIGNVDSEERRELNRTVWRTIQRWCRSPTWLPFEDTNAGGNGVGLGCREAWEEILSVARSCLSERQQQILKMTRDGWKASEIANQLGLTSARVSDEKYKAICRLRDRLDLAEPNPGG